MKKNLLTIVAIAAIGLAAQAQAPTTKAANKWVKTQFKKLSREEKIAQLMVIRAHSNLGAEHVASVADQISKYNVGGLVFFQGGPLRQAALTNKYQALAKTPLLVTIDGEWGLGMRLDSVTRFPYQLTLGALTDDKAIYNMGVAVGKQMKRLGVHVNYAPVVDVNNNPNNPVIGYRSFGEDKYKVARFGVAYSNGMQDAGIMACAKHFPGHGDTEVDSHHDLPVIAKSMVQLDSLELYPFRQLFAAGVGSVMIAHLAIPSIDTTTNRPTSLSKANVTDLLRDELDYDGLTFTDALEMKGVAKFYPAGEAAVQALIAGNDILCLPENVPAAIEAVKGAMKAKRLKRKEIDAKVKKILYAKYALGLSGSQFIDTTNLLADLNASTDSVRTVVAQNTITVLRNEGTVLPLTVGAKTAYIGLGSNTTNNFANRLARDFGATVYTFSYRDDSTKAAGLLQQIAAGGYDKIVIGVHDYSLRPTNNYGISAAALGLWSSLQAAKPLTFIFGNVYAAKNFCGAQNLVASYQDDSISHDAAADFLLGRIQAKGKLPVTVCDIPYGTGLSVNRLAPVGFAPQWLAIDSIVNDGLAKKAYPGAVVLAVQGGKIKYHRAFGAYGFEEGSAPVTLESLYDLASVTKISATTVSIMKLYDEGKVELDKTLGDYLPVTRGTDKAPLKIRDILLHQAGLNPYISFYAETVDKETKQPSPRYYSNVMNEEYTIPVAQNVWLRRDWNDSMMQRIVKSKLTEHGKYVYSDNDFILLGKIVEQLSGKSLDEYTQENFYRPLGMTTTGFKAGERFGMERVVPTERDNYFRHQLLQGYVHDEGAAMFGGVSGHAGLFSNAYDLAALYQMLLNGGELNGRRYLKPETVKLFTAYGSPISRRGLGFDKPEKDNATRKEPYPAANASPATFGHTGFTGTCVWADPEKDLVYIFLSNRVYNTRTNNLLGQMGIRGKVQDAIYRALEKEK
ncbi:MAG: beta-lactamase [Flaviaesturariibacter sp.]|nr:beta-lactamase [Flaviaesturariibacter sp.]